LKVPEACLVEEPSPLTDSIILLEKSYRFKSESAIPAFSASINRGEASNALTLLKDKEQEGVHFRDFISYEKFEEELKSEVLRFFIPLLQSDDPVQMFKILQHFRLLSPHRRGPLGVEYLNKKVESILTEEGLISRFDEWYHGKPVIINQNEYSLGLNNGDIGICFDKDGKEKKVLFKGETGYSAIAPSRLPDFSSAFALTVHKSQGSEFEHVRIILPDKTSKVLTRELLYTAVTRSRSSVSITGKEIVLKDAINARIERSSGLKDLLWPNK
jgi:exodeoxyribonuclease V alpha subunit